VSTPPSGPYGEQYGQPPYGQHYGQPQYGQPHAQQPYPAPPGSGYGYGYGQPMIPFADWGSRAGAYIVDAAIGGIPLAIGYGLFIGNVISRADNYPEDAPAPWAVAAFLLGGVITLGLEIWNRVFRQGRTGQSVGKSVLKIRLVDLRTGQPIGAGRCLLREFLGWLFNNACFVNLLWPLWDEKRQTWHDKVMDTYVVKESA
jgi:uncharacterized RDD family membrane protein YckC